jgi:alcohol dehydrogenase (NADP+)
VFKIPDGVSSAAAAPMMCGGVTLYSPLKHYGCGPGKRVGIVGVGGLGHFGVLFAKALGAEHVVGISRRMNKKEDVLKLGADAYLASEEKNWTQKYVNSLDLILCTVSSSKVCSIWPFHSPFTRLMC